MATEEAKVLISFKPKRRANESRETMNVLLICSLLNFPVVFRFLTAARFEKDSISSAITDRKRVRSV
jgi:hypothetical protein